MKLKFELNGYEITIEETEDKIISVSASKDGEVIEEFELEGGEEIAAQDGEDNDGSQELPEEDAQIDGEEQTDFEETIGESKLESFASFLKRK